MSAPEEGTRRADGQGPYDEPVMDKVAELQQRGRLKMGFDRAGKDEDFSHLLTRTEDTQKHLQLIRNGALDEEGRPAEDGGYIAVGYGMVCRSPAGNRPNWLWRSLLLLLLLAEVACADELPDGTRRNHSLHTNSSCAIDCALDCAADFFVCRCPWAFIGFLSVFVLGGMLGSSYVVVKDMRTRERFKFHQEQGAEVSGRCIARRSDTVTHTSGDGQDRTNSTHTKYYITVVFSVPMPEPTPTAQHVLVTGNFEVNPDNWAHEGSVVQINHLLTATGDVRNAILVSEIEGARENSACTVLDFLVACEVE